MGSATADSRSGIKLFEACINSNLRSFLHSVTPTLEPYTVAKVQTIMLSFKKKKGCASACQILFSFDFCMNQLCFHRNYKK